MATFSLSFGKMLENDRTGGKPLVNRLELSSRANAVPG
jgi:hypothetical protein